MRHKMTLDQSTTTLIGAFGGVLLGHYLSRSWQREQWRLDRRREEYKELLCALSTVFTNKQRFGSGGTGEKDLNIKLEQANAESLRVLRDRIIIAPEIKEANILPLWYKALLYGDAYTGLTDWEKFADAYTELTDTIVRMALLPPPSRLQRMRQKIARLIQAIAAVVRGRFKKARKG
jgi:hypothetical protein